MLTPYHSDLQMQTELLPSYQLQVEAERVERERKEIIVGVSISFCIVCCFNAMANKINSPNGQPNQALHNSSRSDILFLPPFVLPFLFSCPFSFSIAIALSLDKFDHAFRLASIRILTKVRWFIRLYSITY